MTEYTVPSGGDPARIRASDSERDVVAQHLATALSEGRLDLAEYEHRLDLAMAASTQGELVPLTADLPLAERPAAADLPSVPKSAEEAQPSPWLEYFNEWRYWFGGAIIMIGIWGVTSLRSGDFGNFWPAIPLGIWAVVLIAGLVWPSDKKSGG